MELMVQVSTFTESVMLVPLLDGFTDALFG
jgi:hypothetical protein